MLLLTFYDLKLRLCCCNHQKVMEKHMENSSYYPNGNHFQISTGRCYTCYERRSEMINHICLGAPWTCKIWPLLRQWHRCQGTKWTLYLIMHLIHILQNQTHIWTFSETENLKQIKSWVLKRDLLLLFFFKKNITAITQLPNAVGWCL